MDDIQRAIEAAWQTIGPMLERNPAELQRRILRRTNTFLKHPPRPWCLAVRANDTRLFQYVTKRPDREHRNEVILDSRSLYELCSLVWLQPGGETVQDAADKLGVLPSTGLQVMRARGLFKARHVARLGGKSGPPVPILSTSQPLDPSHARFSRPDPAWSFTAEELTQRIPEGIEATITRVPYYRSRVGNYYRDDLHPEHPAMDAGARKRYSLKTPPPQPDPVWYKWKGDQFIGYDWRAAEKNPRIKENYERHQRQLASQRAYKKRARYSKPRQRLAQDSLQFWGWRWLCPKCQRRTRVLYWPLRGISLLCGMLDAVEELAGQNLMWLPFQDGFACDKCHHVMHWSRMRKDAWTEVVAYLSGGLLYGAEVQRPDWFTPDRTIAYAPNLNHKPSTRRPQVEQMLLNGMSFMAIAKELGIGYSTAHRHAQRVFKQHGASNRIEFLKKHRNPALKAK